METAGFITALFALFFSFYTYLVHDKKIKRQEKLINDYNIEKILDEKLMDKKAIIEADVIDGHNGHKIIKVFNKGKSIANKVIVDIPESDGYKVFNNPCPIEIIPTKSINIELGAFSTRCPGTIRIEMRWDDNFKENNLTSQTIQIGTANGQIISRISSI